MVLGGLADSGQQPFGAAGDLYVTAKLSKMSADILIQDSGVSMTVYERLSTGLTKEC